MLILVHAQRDNARLDLSWDLRQVSDKFTHEAGYCLLTSMFCNAWLPYISTHTKCFRFLHLWCTCHNVYTTHFGKGNKAFGKLNIFCPRKSFCPRKDAVKGGISLELYYWVQDTHGHSYTCTLATEKESLSDVKWQVEIHSDHKKT